MSMHCISASFIYLHKTYMYYWALLIIMLIMIVQNDWLCKISTIFIWKKIYLTIFRIDFSKIMYRWIGCTDRPQCRLQVDHYRFVWFDWQHHCQEERSHPQNWHEILVSIHWWKIIDSSPPARFPSKNCSHTYGV